MPTRLVSIPFALGQNEEQSPRELPAGPLREAVNVRQRHGSAFGVRPDYPAVSMTEFDGTLVPYDLYNLNGKLISLGDRQSSSRPTDIFEYVQAAGGAWRGTLPVGAVGERIPVVTAVKDMGQPPDGTFDVATARVGAVNGLVCLAYSDSAVTGGTVTYVHIFDPNTDSTLVFTKLSLSMARVVTVGNSFWILGVTSSQDIEGYRFSTTTDDALQAAVTLYTGTVTLSVYDAVTVFNSVSIAQFALVVRDGVTTVVRRFDVAGVQQLSFAGPAVDPDVIAIEADSSINHIVIAYRVGNADCFIQTFNLTTGVSIIGPTAVFADPVTGSISLTRRTVGAVTCELCTEDSVLLVRRSVFNSTTHVRGNTILENYSLSGHSVAAPGIGVIQPLHSNDDNQLLLLTNTSTSVLPLVTLDRGIAATGFEHLSSFADAGGSTCRDTNTGKYYWSRLIEGTDGQVIPIVTEFVAGSTAKRQAAQIGNELFFSGGLPLIYEGRQCVESGFAEKPLLFSVTGTTGGSLIGGATYDYILIWKWTDSQNREAKSVISDIKTVTLTTSQSATITSASVPHTMRRDSNTGSTPTLSLYRTFGARELTTATITGARDFSSVPASAGDFNGLTLVLSVDGGGNQTVTFAASDNTITEMISAINVQTTGLTAFTDGAFISIESDTDGATGNISVTGGTTTAAGIGFLGFFPGQTDTGTSTFTKGTVFQLAATKVIPLTGNFGAFVSITDTKDDDDLLEAEPLYTNGERGALTGILQHTPPPPCKYCWTVGNRVFIGGLPDPSEVRISKALFPTESVAFSDNFAFVSFVDGTVTAVAGLDGVPIAFTEEAIYTFSNELPDDSGGSGELGAPRKLPSDGGCTNWASIVETSMGLFYQARDFKLMLIPRGGGTPIWAGKLVQDTLALFPNITGASYVDVDHCVVFTCKSVGLTSSVILVFDLRVGQWYKDTFPVAQVINAAVPHGGLLAYIDSAVVRIQSTNLTPGAFIPYNAKTGSLQPFGGNGWGKLDSITVHGEKRGNARIQLRISYDDGVTFTTLTKVFSITTANGFVTGESFVCQWWPARRKGCAFVLDFQVVEDSGGTEALILNEYTLEIETAQPVGRVRTSSGERG